MSPSRKDRREEERLAAKVAKRALPLYPDSAGRRPIRLAYAGALASGTSPKLQQALDLLLRDAKADLGPAREA